MSVELLTGNSFEVDSNADGLADGWLEEHTTASAATYSLSTTGAVLGTYAQRMQYTAAGGDSNKKVEFYQTVTGFAAGDAATFEVWLSGTVTGATYAQIIIEAHTGVSTYLAEVSTVCTITSTPQPFRLTYPSLPATTDTVVVVIICPEMSSGSSCDIYADAASLFKENIAARTLRTNYIQHPSFELGTTLPTGWTESNSIGGSVTYTLSTSGVTYGSKKLNAAYTASADTNKVVQLISASSATGTFAPGDQGTVSILVDGTLTGVNFILRIQWLTSVGGSAGTSDSGNQTVNGTPTRVSWTATAPASTAAARVLLRFTSISTPDSFNVNLDGCLLEKVGSAGTYFDGATTGFQWLGTANASISRETVSMFQGTGASTLAAVTSAGAGTETFTGTGASTLAYLLSAGVGTHTDSGEQPVVFAGSSRRPIQPRPRLPLQVQPFDEDDYELVVRSILRFRLRT